MTKQNPKIDYQTKQITENIEGIKVNLVVLEDLDKTIDQICEVVQIDPFAEDLCPYFGVVWPAARALAGHIAKMGTFLRDKTVLEIGCGLAIPSIIAAKNGAKVTATDFHPAVPEFLAKNVQLNQVSFNYEPLNWRTDHGKLGKFDFLIASDVLYETSHPAQVALAFDAHCHKQTHIILADPGRTYLQAFVDEMKKLGYRSDMFIHNVPITADKKSGTHDVFLFTFQKA